jgi:hypothetical protein
MRSTRLLSAIFVFCLLPHLCFAESDKSPHTIADLPPEAQTSIVAALAKGAESAQREAEKQASPKLPFGAPTTIVLPLIERCQVKNFAD